MENNNSTVSKLGARKWIIFILIGLMGQFAWTIENMYLNTYITYLNFSAPAGQGFEYSTFIAVTTALSAITATFTTLFMGGLTDKLNKRKYFISFGYLIWGLATASFGLFNVTSNNELIPISMAASSAAIMVIIVDCIMTFFGSTANDAAFNSYVTINTNDKNRGKVEGVLQILPLISMLIIFVGLNGLTTDSGGNRWDLFFYIIGGLVFIVGIISLFLIPKEVAVTRKEEKYFSIMLDGFKPSTIKENKKLYLILIAYFIYSVATQIYFPYLMVYIEKTSMIANTGSSFLTPFAIVMALALLLGSAGSVLISSLGDKKGRIKITYLGILVLVIGLFMMFFNPYIKDDTGRIIYSAVSGTIMILGYIALQALLNAEVRNNVPKGKEGIFMGVRMIFVVLLPMCIGPFIGDALNKNLGDTYEGTYGVVSVIPTNRGYIVALGVLLLTLIPLYFIHLENKKSSLKEQNQ